MTIEYEPPEICKEMANYARAQRITIGLKNIADIIPHDEREQFNIPKNFDLRSTRNAIARQSLGISQNCDTFHIENAANIAKWLLSKMED